MRLRCLFEEENRGARCIPSRMERKRANDETKKPFRHIA
jgi:hypothetical protein